MRARILVLIAALSIAVPAFAQRPHGHQRDPGTSEQQAAPAPRQEPAPKSEPAHQAPPPSAPAPTPAPLVAVPRAAAQAPAPPTAAAPVVRTYPQRQRDPGVDTRQAVPLPPRYSTLDHDHHDGGRVILPAPRRYYN